MRPARSSLPLLLLPLALAAAEPAPAPDRPPLDQLRQPVAPAAGPLRQDAAGYWIVDFGRLASFTYGTLRGGAMDEPAAPRGRRVGELVPDGAGIIDPPAAPGEAGPLPPEVQALDGRRVRLAGFMLPVKSGQGRVTEFLVLRNQLMCCYGLPPAPNEWVLVRVPGAGIPVAMDRPLHFYGTLRVAELFEHGIFVALYRLELERAAAE